MVESSASFKMESKSGTIYFDIKEEGKEHYLKITQSKHLGDGYRREKIFITEQELLQFKELVDKALSYWQPKTECQPSQRKEKSYTMEQKRERYGNAYLPWEKQADELLLKLYGEGKTIEELSEIFERNTGAIISRLNKFGLVEQHQQKPLWR